MRGVALLLVLIGACPAHSRAQGTTPPIQPIRLLPFIISPADRQLPAILDSANRYKRLYYGEKAISNGYQQADQISQQQYVRADSAYQAEQHRADVATTDLTACAEVRTALEQERKAYRPPTKAGRILRQTRNVLAVVGGVEAVRLLLRLTLLR